MNLSVSAAVLAALASLHSGDAFSNTLRPALSPAPLPAISTSNVHVHKSRNNGVAMSSTSADTETTQSQQLSSTVSKLKQVLAKEYISFFNPMVDSWYAPDVTFDDPMTTLSGVDAYRNNVDMLAGRTWMGKVLFDGAGINLHSVTGGKVVEKNGNVEIENVITRWTLRVTAKVIPWKPEAVFSGISVYKIQEGGKEGVTIVGQTDYWDSINIKEGTDSTEPLIQYQKVPVSVAVSDFLDQLKPGGFLAPPAGPELPFTMLRRGDGYELRKYPGFVGIETTYQRRDFGFGQLGAFASGMNPMAPSMMKVYNDDDSEVAKDKKMMWPLQFTNPGEGSAAPAAPSDAVEKAGKGQWKSIGLNSENERVVAVRSFDDAAMGPVVRNSDRELRVLLKRDGLIPEEGTEEFVTFAQYDAVHSMGKRRGEVWVELKDGGHPF